MKPLFFQKGMVWIMDNMIGKQLTSFCVQGYRQGNLVTVTNNDLWGKWNILFFYPADFTFVCPTELGDMEDHYSDFQKEGCEIYSVSTDSEYVHKAWADASDTIRRIRYTMLSDHSWILSEAFGVLVSGQALRATFIIDPKGMIRSYEVNDMGIGRSAAEILRKLQAAKFVAEHGDQVCPANWKPGDETLKPSLDLVGKL